jgi:hypothetical protein
MAIPRQVLCRLWKAYYYASDETDTALGDRFAFALVAAVELPDWVDEDETGSTLNLSGAGDPFLPF